MGDGSDADGTNDCREVFEDSPIEFGQAEFIDVLDLEHLLYGLQGDLSCSYVNCHVAGPQEETVQNAGDSTAF